MKDYTNFRKSDDPNIIPADVVGTEELHVDKLTAKIVDLKREIENVTELISTEGVRDERVIALINDYNNSIKRPEDLEKSLADYGALIVKCEKVK